MNIRNITNNFSCGVFYTKDSILYYLNKQGEYRTTKFTEAEYQILKYLSFDIEKEEKKFKNLKFASVIIILFSIFGFSFFGNAAALAAKGLTFDNYIKMKMLNKSFVNMEIEKTRLSLIDAIKSDYPGIKLNEEEVNVFEVKKPNKTYSAVYITDIFNDNVILIYDNLTDYQAHEVIHHLSNHSFYWQNQFSNSRAINEGITEYIKIKYMPETKVTYQEKFYADAIISIFGEEVIIRDYLENSNKELEKLLNIYSNDFDLLKEINNDHLKYNNDAKIKEYIVQTFLNYLQRKQSELVDIDSYVNNFISSLIQNPNQDIALYNRIIKEVSYINSNYSSERNI